MRQSDPVSRLIAAARRMLSTVEVLRRRLHHRGVGLRVRGVQGHADLVATGGVERPDDGLGQEDSVRGHVGDPDAVLAQPADQGLGVLAKERLAAAHQPDAPDAHGTHLSEQRVEPLTGELEIAGADLRRRAEETVDVAAVLPRDLDHARRRRILRPGDGAENRGLLLRRQVFPGVGHGPDLTPRLLLFSLSRRDSSTKGRPPAVENAVRSTAVSGRGEGSTPARIPLGTNR
jgi:hypothetical protein